MERFIRLNRSILDCDLAKGGWRLDISFAKIGLCKDEWRTGL